MIIDLKDSNQTIAEALFTAKENDTIILDGITYFEKIRVTIPNLTILGREGSCISWNDYAGKIIPVEMGGDGEKKYGTTTSATFTVAPEAKGFKAKNIIFHNTHDRRVFKKGQAVAFKCESSNCVLDDCKFISQQDTLYFDYGFNNVVNNSYVEGDVDFIFGSADCTFNNCNFKAINIFKSAYFTAPNTYVINDNGFVFIKCKFYTEEDFEVYIGRAWYPSGAIQPVFPKIKLVDCEIKGNIKPYLIQMHENDEKAISFEVINTNFNGEIINTLQNESV